MNAPAHMDDSMDAFIVASCNDEIARTVTDWTLDEETCEALVWTLITHKFAALRRMGRSQ